MQNAFCRLALVCLAAVNGACGTPVRKSIAETAPPQSRQPRYRGTVAVDPSNGTLTAAWRLQIARAANADSLSFLINSGLRLTQVVGSEVRSYHDTVVNGQRRLTVFLSPTAASGITTIAVSYSGRPVFSPDSINGISPRWIELGLDSFWLPIVDDFQHEITGDLTLHLPHGWQVATSGQVRTRSGVHHIAASIPLIDVSFSAAPSFHVVSDGRARLHHVGAVDSVVRRVAAVTNACGEHLERRYAAAGALPQLNIVLAPRRGPGYARKNYIVITPAAEMSPRALTRFICHEIAHFWSTGAVSSGPDNWINEGFAEFVSNRAVRELLSRAHYDSTVGEWRRNADGAPPVWTGPTGRRPLPRVAYSKAPLLLHRLEERAGVAAMDSLLRRFLREPIRTTPAVIHLVGEVMGAETGSWFREELAR